MCTTGGACGLCQLAPASRGLAGYVLAACTASGQHPTTRPFDIIHCPSGAQADNDSALAFVEIGGGHPAASVHATVVAEDSGGGEGGDGGDSGSMQVRPASGQPCVRLCVWFGGVARSH